MFRIMICIVLIVCTTLLGNWFALRLRHRSDYLRKMLIAIKRMKTLICFGGYEIERVITDAFSGVDEYSVFSETATQKELSVWWSEQIDKIDKNSGLSIEDRSVMKRFSDGLGVSDIEGQISNCELYSGLIEERLRLSEEDELKKSRLYRVLGFSLGAILALLFL